MNGSLLLVAVLALLILVSAALQVSSVKKIKPSGESKPYNMVYGLSVAQVVISAILLALFGLGMAAKKGYVPHSDKITSLMSRLNGL